VVEETPSGQWGREPQKSDIFLGPDLDLKFLMDQKGSTKES
jgi:hypothetical protein